MPLLMIGRCLKPSRGEVGIDSYSISLFDEHLIVIKNYIHLKNDKSVKQKKIEIYIENYLLPINSRTFV